LDTNDVTLGRSQNPSDPRLTLIRDVICGLRFLPTDTNTRSRSSREEGIDRLPVIAKDKIALSERASCQYLDRIDATGIVLDNGDDFLIIGLLLRQSIQASKRHAVAHREPGANVTMKLRNFFECYFRHDSQDKAYAVWA